MFREQKGNKGIMKCHGCQKDLNVPRNKFEWLVSRGFTEKDAAAQILFAPSGKPIKQCCIVNLQMNVDPNKTINERLEAKLRIEGEEKLKQVKSGITIKEREMVKIFASSPNRDLAGEFMLVDSSFNDPTLLAGSFADRSMGLESKGFTITDVSPISTEVASKQKWSNIRPMALWSGNIKIVPVINKGDFKMPALMWMQDAYGNLKPITAPERSIIQGDIISYDIQSMGFKNKNDPNSAPIEFPFHVITVLKQLPEEIIV